MDMLEKVDIHLVEHCNLNCKGCTHFSPLAEPSFLNIEDFKGDVKRLSELTGAKLGQLFLLGGEPLLHPSLTDFFPVARECFPNTDIIIITNGILLPSQNDEFWLKCKKYNIHIWVSLYRIKIDYEKINSKAREFGVFCGYTGTALTEDEKKYWGNWKLDLEGKQYWIDSFSFCQVKNCVTLKKGKLYTCPTAAHIEHFKKYFNVELDVCEYDYLDIYKARNHESILSAMVKPIPFCRFCKTREFQKSFWELTKKEISEWA